MESFTSNDASRATGGHRVAALDALRAVAMTVVVAEHSRLFTFGWGGVWLFYVISGFVVTGALESRAHAGPLTRIGDFWARRCARIMPAYYAWVALAVAVCVARGLTFDPRAVASLVFFFNNFAMASGRGDLPGFSVGNLWTVSVEMQFYALYGLLFVLAPRAALIAVLVALLIACPAMRYLYGESLTARGAPPLDAAFRVYSFSVLHFDAFAYGCLLSLLRHRLTWRTCVALATAALLTTFAYMATYAQVNATLGARGMGVWRNVISGILFGQHREAFVYIAVDLCATSLVAAAFLATRSRDSRIEAWLSHVGKVSYGAYLYHGVALLLAGELIAQVAPFEGGLRFIARALQFLVALAMLIPFATLSFERFEQPLTRLVGRRLAQSSRGVRNRVLA